jgi:hypothetical protein
MAAATAAVTGHRAASDYLRHLLLRPLYQAEWQPFSTRTRRGIINQVAAAEVLAGHLRSAPRSPADRHATSQQLKDTVSSALTGRLLSPPALELFIDAFGFTRYEAARLRQLREGSLTIGELPAAQVVRKGRPAGRDGAQHRCHPRSAPA